MAKIFVVMGVNHLVHSVGPVGVARTEAGVQKVKDASAWVCDEMKVFEMELEEDKEPK